VKGKGTHIEVGKGGLRIPGTVRTTNMFTIRTDLDSSLEQRRALMARPPNPLHGLLPHKRLPTSPTRPRQDVFLPHTPIRIRLNGSLHRGHRSLVLLALLAFRLRLLYRIAGTLGAACMFACSADFIPTECGLTFMTCPMDAHTNWLLDAQSFFVGLGGEVVRLDSREFEAFAQSVGSLGVDLRPHYLHRLWSVFCSNGCGCLFNWSWCRFGSFGCTGRCK
jgi:hypothetical protein